MGMHAVRAARNPGFERIVFQFMGANLPGYQIQWSQGPITTDGSGIPVSVNGAAYLRIALSSASRTDPSTGDITYAGPDRPVIKTSLITDLVLTGDFQSTLSWVAGASSVVPFRVFTLTAPSRLVVDLQSPGP